MPILATIAGRGRDVVAVPEDDRRLEFRMLDGTEAIDWTGDEYIITSGIQGLHVPPREVVTEQIPGLDGARLREIRTGIRTVVLPFFVYSDDHDYRSHRKQLQLLRQHVNYRDRDYVGAEGTFDLVAVADGGERLLRCVYSEGMEGVTGYADGNAAFWSTFGLTLQAVDPYWHGDEWSTPTVGTGTGSVFLADTGSYHWPRQISASVALGEDMHVNVDGDIPSPPTIELVGPFTSATITSPQGLDISVGAVTSGTLLIQTGRQRAVTLDGTAAWDLIGDSPQWQPLPPGDAVISILVPGATEDTAARVYGTALWETAW